MTVMVVGVVVVVVVLLAMVLVSWPLMWPFKMAVLRGNPSPMSMFISCRERLGIMKTWMISIRNWTTGLLEGRMDGKQPVVRMEAAPLAFKFPRMKIESTELAK